MKYLALSFFLILINSIWALECPTCYGDNCAGAVQVQKCNKNLPKLPFKLKEEPNVATSDYTCLHLEYFKDGEIYEIQQCHLVEEKTDLCKIIRQSVNEYSPVVTCSVSKTKSVEVAPFDQLAEGSGDDDGGGAISHTVSFLAMLFVIVFKFF